MKKDRKLTVGRALLFAGGTIAGFCVCCIDGNPWLGCIGTLVGILGMFVGAMLESVQDD